MPSVTLEKTNNLQRIEFHRSDITSCDIDASLRIVIGSSDRTVTIWEWKAGCGFVQVFYSPITEHKYGVSNVLCLPNASVTVTSSLDGSISLWNTDNGVLLHTFMHENLVPVRSCCYLSYYNYIVSAGDDGSLCIWSIEKKTLVKVVQAHEETIPIVCSSTDGSIIITGDINGLVKVWHTSTLCDFNSTSMSTPSSLLYSIVDCHDLGVSHADFSRNTSMIDEGKVYRFVTCGNDNAFKLWQLVLKKQSDVLYQCDVNLITVYMGHTSAVTSVKFNPFGNYVASASMDKTVRLWKTFDDYRCEKVLGDHSRYVTTCSFSPDGTLLVTGSNDKSFIVWDLTGQLSSNSSFLLNDLPRTPDTQNINVTRKANLKGLKISQKISNLGNAINSCCFSKNDFLAAGGTDKLVRLWHRSSNTNQFVELSVSPLQGHKYGINQVDFSACGTLLASCSMDGTAIIWDMIEYKMKCTLFGVEGGVKCCRFSPNTKYLATGGDREVVTVWRVENERFIREMSDHSDAITSLSFTCDSRYLASGCAGGHFRIWLVEPCCSICVLFAENVHDLGLTSLDFPLKGFDSKNNDKYLLATCGNDSLIKIWHITVVSEVSAKHTLIHQLQGHGGDVTCIRFPSNSYDLVASTATDKTVRIWDTNSGVCLHVLDSKYMMLTSCSFSADGSLLAAAGLNKSIIIWDLRTTEDEFEQLAKDRVNSEHRYNANILEDDNFLKKLEKGLTISMSEIPEHFICPITQQIMLDPVICADGYSYERNAIESWFVSGKYTSPMTNESLSSIKLIPNTNLKSSIEIFIDNHSKKSVDGESGISDGTTG